MSYSNINDYLLRDDQFFTVKEFYINSSCVFNNFFDILECVRLLNSKSMYSDTKNLLKYYYLGCTGLRLNNIDIIYGSLSLWSLAEQILDFNKKHNIKLDILPIALNKGLKEIKNFYFWTIAKNEDDFRKVDPYQYKKM